MTRTFTLPSRVSTLALAAALAAGPSPALAQSLQGTPTVSSGSATVTEGTNTTDVTVNSSQAVIDWVPDDNLVGNFGAIAFQNSGTTATFSSASDFAVLNRINVADNSRQIFMNGTIQSIVGNSVGGSVYFYSPSGFVIGSSAIINVGSLVLTSRPITVDGQGNFINNGTVTFGAVADPFGNPLNAAAAVTTVAGSQINALTDGSYIAMVAPLVAHHGTINVNGGAALVGAEGATVTFRPSGLFDIQVDIGTTNGQGVAIDGTITGPASSGSGDYHRIYAVAVPKNTALTMAISSGANLGFDIAQAADVVGNTVVLSAGHDVFFGSPESVPSSGGAGGVAANLAIDDADFTSAVVAEATGYSHVFANTATTFASDAYFHSVQENWVSAQGAGVLSVAGDLTMSTDIQISGSSGGSVIGSQAALYAGAGGSILLSGDLNISSNTFGGDSFVSGTPSGNATGGQVLVQAEANSSVSIAGNIVASANGYGGQPGASGVNGGDGRGGSIFIGTNGGNASFSVAGVTTATANGYGGAGDGSSNECFDCNGLGGTGTGGNILVGATASISTAYFGDIVDLHSDGLGGRSAQPGTAAGSGTGGYVRVEASGGSQIEGFGLTFASDLMATATGQGGESTTAGIAAGSGQGGTVELISTANSTMGILGNLQAEADGRGGFNDFDVDGGNGSGGTIGVSAQNGNSLISVTGNTDLVADGEGSDDNSDCIGCAGAGGNGSGGNVNVFGGSGTNNRLIFNGSLDLSAEGTGGIGATGNAGSGDGGSATVSLASGLAVSVGNGLVIEAEGNGGFAYNASNGGTGIGGTAAIYGNGGSLAVTGNSFIEAGGYGGGGYIEGTGNGGNGVGGIAQVWAPSGSVDFSNSLFMTAVGEGGNAPNGIGGNGQGGTVGVEAPGGAIHVAGNLSGDAGATGGSGLTGGNASGLVFVQNTDPVSIDIYVRNGGSIDVDGVAVLSADAAGGDGSNGSGGSAQGGEVDLIGYAGTIDIGSLAIDAQAQGGSGGAGGNGGNATGGRTFIDFGGGAAATGATITLGSATITTDGDGGDGGAGLDGATGGDGGAGGDGTGGRIGFTGSAGSGTLITGTAVLSSVGRGGAGGLGGAGSVGAGGNGGAGGDGGSNGIQTGTVSVDLAPNPGGGATYSFLSLDSSAFGGVGGDGGSGAGGTGTGGDGGNALGGGASFLARGVLVTADTVLLNANATGGDGGQGSIQGDGGNARTGSIAVESKDRFNHPDQRGTLVVNSVVGSAIAVGGSGAVNGTGSVIGGSYFRVLNGDATIGSLDFTISGDVYDPTFVNSTVSVRDGTATIGDFSFTTTGELALDASNGSMTANSINLAAGTFIPDAFSGAQVGPGTYTAGSFGIFTDGNFVTNAHLVSGGSLSILAPGAIDMRDATSSDGNLTLNAGTSILAGNLSAAGFVSVLGADNVTIGDVNSGDFIGVDSSNGAISTGNLTAVAGIDLNASGAISFLDVLGEALDFDSGAAVAGGNIVVGREVKGDAGTTITLGNISAGVQVTGGPADNGYSVGLASPGSIIVGNIEANESIGLATLGNLTTGTIDSGGDALALASGNMSLGAITTPNSGRTYLADGSMFIDAGGPDNFDPALVFAATPVSTGGSILIGGSVSTGRFQAASGAAFASGSITAPLGITIEAGGGILTGALSSDDEIYASSDGSIDTGAITSSAGDLFLFAGSSIATGAINTGGLTQLVANGGNVTTGNINATGSVVVSASGNASVGNLGGTTIGLSAGGDIGFGNVGATALQFDAGGAVSGGSVAATDGIFGSAGGLLSINGLWQAPSAYVQSNDIAIASTGGIDTGPSGSISLISTNATQTQIGDGLSGTGYQLSNAEFGRLSSGSVQIIGRADASANVDMLIGDLSVTGPLAGSTIDDPNGYVDFVTADFQNESIGGVIRVVGELRATGFLDTNTIDFTTGRFELDAETGLIQITGSTTSDLSGELFIEADRIHAASGNILDQLAANPDYSGREDDLNAPAAVQRPEGVIRAGSIDFDVTQAVLVQNTGTAETPAGFLTFGDGPLFSADNAPPGPIELIINGQLITEGGTLTGSDVRDYLIDDNNIGFFTANSTINGCLLTGSCSNVVEPPFPPDFTPTPGIQQEIVLLGDDPAPPPEFGNEDAIDDNEEDEAAETSPIAPPEPLFDTTELGEPEATGNPAFNTTMRSHPGLVEEGDVDDPVSGSGNPALMEDDTPSPSEEKQQ